MQGTAQRAAAGSVGEMSMTSTPLPWPDQVHEPGASVGHGAEALFVTYTSGSPEVGVTVMATASLGSLTTKVK